MDDEFTKAFNEEMGGEPLEETPTVVAEPEEAPVEPEETPAEPEAPAEPEEAPAEPEPEAPKYATKDDVIEAMREYNHETSERVNTIVATKEEIISKIHPEGIDTSLYDSNGNVIKTAQDIVDRGLLNERTGEPFTYEEAASWMLGAQQKMNQNLEEMNKWATDIAEKNISLVESNQRVMQKHGDLLQNNPNLAKQLAEVYITKQLEFDPSGSYITRMAMDPETFYDLALAPYRQTAAVLAEKRALEEAQAAQQQQANQDERSGLPPQRGSSKTKSNTGDAHLDALIDELNS